MHSHWKIGDLLVVTKRHVINPGSMEQAWPYVCEVKSARFSRFADKNIFVVAMDLKPQSGPAFIRAIHEEGIWVFKSNCVKPVKLDPI